MKYLNLLLLLGFFIASLSVYGQTDCLPEDDQALCTAIQENIVDIVEHPDYPGCPLTVLENASYLRDQNAQKDLSFKAHVSNYVKTTKINSYAK